jgi:tRNA pseudouridine55 synthase
LDAYYLPLNKAPGLTSFEALFPVKRALGTGKVGHTGTLDKFAGGLMLVLTGKALKLSSCFSGCGKTYEALVRFGAETDTLDPEGAVVAEAPLPSREAVEAALGRFRGPIMQTPPVYSAIHIAGRRAHELARSGASVEMKPRPVTIQSLELTRWEPPFAAFAVRCSAGTYIRSLARDIALASSSRAHLAALTRTEVGGFTLNGALADTSADAVRAALRPLDRQMFAALSVPVADIDGAQAASVRQGRPIDASALPPPPAAKAALFHDGRFVALLERADADRWKYAFVF